MPITTDWHIHTTHSCDCAESGIGVPMAGLVAAAAAQGITDLGVTDHVNTPYNLDELFRSREAFDALPFNPHFHFGVEASCVSAWELEAIESGRQLAQTWGLRQGGPPGGELAIGINEEDMREYGIEYVVAGVHWPMYIEPDRDAVIRDYHRQNVFLASHPLVDIVAHPWWWMGWWANDEGRYLSDPWLDDFGKIPLSMHDEFAAATRENQTAVEINLHACLFNAAYPDTFAPQYVDYLCYLQERGVVFSFGSDSHGPTYEGSAAHPLDFAAAERLLEPLGLKPEAMWQLAPRPAPEPSPPPADKPLSKYQRKRQARGDE